MPWIDRAEGSKFIQDNPSVQYWLSRIKRTGTKDSYARALNAFSKAVKLSPEELLVIRGTPKDQLQALRLKLGLPQPKNGNDDGGYVILDLLQNFILSGIVHITRTYKSGKVYSKTTKIADCSKKYKHLLYYSVISFFLYNRATLPKDKFDITDNVSRTTVKTKYMPLEPARAIIGASKSPYKELFTVQLYAAVGVGEILALNEMWPNIRGQLQGGKDVVKIDFSYRKTNPNPYFTYLPSSILAKFKEQVEGPFKTNRGKAIGEADLRSMWRNSKKRAGIKEGYTPHMFRDLFSTEGLTGALIGETYTEFLLGHQIDTNEYKQLYQQPEKVLEEWSKWRSYLDTGASTLMAGQVDALRNEVINRLLDDREELQEEITLLEASGLKADKEEGIPTVSERKLELKQINERLTRLGYTEGHTKRLF